MPPAYDLNKIKFATDAATFQRGVALYEKGRVTGVEEAFGDYTAIVLGTRPYRVSVSGRRFGEADCTCYLGEQGTLCKHVVALALHAVLAGRPLKEQDKQPVLTATCGQRREALSPQELTEFKKAITQSLRYIKPYTGPSRTWFANQDSLQEGCNRLRALVSALPVNRSAADILVKLLLRLDKKLCQGGVDDSNGIVGDFIVELVNVLLEFAQKDAHCIAAFTTLRGRQTCFGWEAPLVRLCEGI